MKRAGKVYFNKNIWSPYSYRVDKEINDLPRRVDVEFGRKKVEGFLTDIFFEEQKFDLKPLLKVKDKFNYLFKKDVEFLKEVSKKLLIPYGRLLMFSSPPFYVEEKIDEVEFLEGKRELKLYEEFASGDLFEEIEMDLESKMLFLIYPDHITEKFFNGLIEKNLGLKVVSLKKAGKKMKDFYKDYFYKKLPSKTLISGTILPIFLPVVKNFSIYLIGESARSFRFSFPIEIDIREVSILKSEIFSSALKIFSYPPSLRVYKYVRDNGGEIIKGKSKKKIKITFNFKKRTIDREIENLLLESSKDRERVLLLTNKVAKEKVIYCHKCRVALEEKEVVEDENGNKIHKKCGKKVIFISPFGVMSLKEKIGKKINDIDLRIIGDKKAHKNLDDIEKIVDDEGVFILSTSSILKPVVFEKFDRVVWFFPEELLIDGAEGGEKIFSVFYGIKEVLKNGKELIVKTFFKNNYVFDFFERSFEEFVKEELSMRKELHYYPFYESVNFIFEGKNKENLLKKAKNAKKILAKIEGAEVFGPFYKKGRETKFSIILRFTNSERVLKKLYNLLEKKEISPEKVLLNRVREF